MDPGDKNFRIVSPSTAMVSSIVSPPSAMIPLDVSWHPLSKPKREPSTLVLVCMYFCKKIAIYFNKIYLRPTEESWVQLLTTVKSAMWCKKDIFSKIEILAQIKILLVTILKCRLTMFHLMWQYHNFSSINVLFDLNFKIHHRYINSCNVCSIGCFFSVIHTFFPKRDYRG